MCAIDEKHIKSVDAKTWCAREMGLLAQETKRADDNAKLAADNARLAADNGKRADDNAKRADDIEKELVEANARADAAQSELSCVRACLNALRYVTMLQKGEHVESSVLSCSKQAFDSRACMQVPP
jgi:hypothetical protein